MFISINNMESIFYLLQNKVGFTIFPSEPLLEFVAAKKVKIHRTGKTVTSPLYLVQRQGQALPRRIEALRELILDSGGSGHKLARPPGGYLASPPQKF